MDTQTLGCSDGATLELADGFRYRVSIKPDSDSTINDYDSDGRYEWVGRDPHTQRPDTFDGCAMKLWTDSDAFWWQPYDSAWWHGLTPIERLHERSRIANLVTYGFVGVVVELERLCEMGHWHGVEVASLWSVEWDATETNYGREIVADLVAELGHAN